MLSIKFQILGIIIFAIAIAGIDQSIYRLNRDYFIVILAFIILIGVVSIIQFIYQRKSQSVYDVQGSVDAEKGSNKGAENKSFEQVEKKEDEKWVKNYVPYGDYPNGSEAQKQVPIGGSKIDQFHT